MTRGARLRSLCSFGASQPERAVRARSGSDRAAGLNRMAARSSAEMRVTSTPEWHVFQAALFAGAAGNAERRRRSQAAPWEAAVIPKPAAPSKAASRLFPVRHRGYSLFGSGYCPPARSDQDFMNVVMRLSMRSCDGTARQVPAALRGVRTPVSGSPPDRFVVFQRRPQPPPP